MAKEKLIKVVTADGQVVHVPPGSSVFVDGMQVPDPTPVEMPLGFERPESLESMLVRLVHQVSRGQADIGEESIDDANDFDVDDEELMDEVFTDAEYAAIMATPEMKEQFLRAEEEKKRGESERDSGSREIGEEDERGGEGHRGRNGRDGDGKRRQKGNRERSERRSEGVARRDSRRRDYVEEDSEDFGEGDE